MAEAKLEYRIWQQGDQWHWQALAEDKAVVASGVAKNSATARAAAFKYCLDRNHRERRSLD
jgi:hypothetical protein